MLGPFSSSSEFSSLLPLRFDDHTSEPPFDVNPGLCDLATTPLTSTSSSSSSSLSQNAHYLMEHHPSMSVCGSDKDGFSHYHSNASSPSPDDYYFSNSCHSYHHRPSFDYQLNTNTEDPICNITVRASFDNHDGTTDLHQLSASVTAVASGSSSSMIATTTLRHHQPSGANGSISTIDSSVIRSQDNTTTSHQLQQKSISLLDDHNSTEDVHADYSSNFSSAYSQTELYHQPSMSLLDTPVIPAAAPCELSPSPGSSDRSLSSLSVLKIGETAAVDRALSTASNYSSSSMSPPKKHARDGSEASSIERSSRRSKRQSLSSRHHHDTAKKESNEQQRSRWKGEQSQCGSASKSHRRRHHQHLRRQHHSSASRRSRRESPPLGSLATTTTTTSSSLPYSSTPEKRRGLLVSGGSLNHSAYTLRGGVAAASLYPGRSSNQLPLGAYPYYEPIGGILSGPISHFSMRYLPSSLEYSSPYLTAAQLNPPCSSSDYFSGVIRGSSNNPYGDLGYLSTSNQYPQVINMDSSRMTNGRDSQLSVTTSTQMLALPQRLGYAASSPPSDGPERATKKQRVISSSEGSSSGVCDKGTTIPSPQENGFSSTSLLLWPSQLPNKLSSFSECSPLSTAPTPDVLSSAPSSTASSSAVVTASSAASILSHTSTTSPDTPPRVPRSLTAVSISPGHVAANSQSRRSPTSQHRNVEDEDDDVVFERCVRATATGSQSFTGLQQSTPILQPSQHNLCDEKKSDRNFANQSLDPSLAQPSSLASNQAGLTGQASRNTTTWGNPIVFPNQQVLPSTVARQAAFTAGQTSSCLGQASCIPISSSLHIPVNHRPVVLGQELSSAAAIIPITCNTPSMTSNTPINSRGSAVLKGTMTPSTGGTACSWSQCGATLSAPIANLLVVGSTPVDSDLPEQPTPAFSRSTPVRSGNHDALSKTNMVKGRDKPDTSEPNSPSQMLHNESLSLTTAPILSSSSSSPEFPPFLSSVVSTPPLHLVPIARPPSRSLQVEVAASSDRGQSGPMMVAHQVPVVQSHVIQKPCNSQYRSTPAVVQSSAPVEELESILTQPLVVAMVDGGPSGSGSRTEQLIKQTESKMERKPSSNFNNAPEKLTSNQGAMTEELLLNVSLKEEPKNRGQKDSIENRAHSDHDKDRNDTESQSRREPPHCQNGVEKMNERTSEEGGQSEGGNQGGQPQEIVEESSAENSESSTDTAVDGSVVEILVTSLISVFNGIFTEEHKIKKQQLAVGIDYLF